MKKIFWKLFAFVSLLSLFVPMFNNTVAEGGVGWEKRNPITLAWELKKDIGGVKVYVAITPRKASDNAQAKSNLWAFWYVANDTSKNIELKIANKVYKTSVGDYLSPHDWTVFLKPGERTETQYLSHLQLQEWVDSNPNTQFHSVDFSVTMANDKTEKGDFGNLSGKWSVIGSKDKKANIIKIKDDGQGNLCIIEEKEGTEWGFMKFNKATGEITKNETFEIMEKPVTINLHMTLVSSGGKITGSGTLQSIQSGKEETIKLSVEKVSD